MQNNYSKLVFCVLSGQLLHHINILRLHFTFRKELVRRQEKKAQMFWEFSVFSWVSREFSSCLHWYIMFSEAATRGVLGLRPATLFKKKLWYRCLPVNFVKLLRIPFLQNTSGRVLLCFERAQIFHISHFTYHLRYYMIIDYCWSC